MNKICYTIIIFLIVYINELTAQNVINSTGNLIFSTNYSIEYSVGELTTTTLENNNNYLTQGFIQPFQAFNVGVSDEFEKNYLISIFPNPVTFELIINTNYNYFETFSITDINGKIIINDNWKSNLISFQDYPQGIYILTLRNNIFSKSFKIVKQ